MIVSMFVSMSTCTFYVNVHVNVYVFVSVNFGIRGAAGCWMPDSGFMMLAVGR